MRRVLRILGYVVIGLGFLGTYIATAAEARNTWLDNRLVKLSLFSLNHFTWIVMVGVALICFSELKTRFNLNRKR